MLPFLWICDVCYAMWYMLCFVMCIVLCDVVLCHACYDMWSVLRCVVCVMICDEYYAMWWGVMMCDVCYAVWCLLCYVMYVILCDMCYALWCVIFCVLCVILCDACHALRCVYAVHLQFQNLWKSLLPVQQWWKICSAVCPWRNAAVRIPLRQQRSADIQSQWKCLPNAICTIGVYFYLKYFILKWEYMWVCKIEN